MSFEVVVRGNGPYLKQTAPGISIDKLLYKREEKDDHRFARGQEIPRQQVFVGSKFSGGF